jgi:hypothetical protein
VRPSRRDSYERLCHDAGVARFLLDPERDEAPSPCAPLAFHAIRIATGAELWFTVSLMTLFLLAMATYTPMQFSSGRYPIR